MTKPMICSNCGADIPVKIVRIQGPCPSCRKEYPYSVTLFDNSVWKE